MRPLISRQHQFDLQFNAAAAACIPLPLRHGCMRKCIQGQAVAEAAASPLHARGSFCFSAVLANQYMPNHSRPLWHRWHMWPSVAAVALVHHLRHWQTVATCKLLTQGADIKDRLEFVSFVLKVPRAVVSDEVLWVQLVCLPGEMQGQQFQREQDGDRMLAAGLLD